MSWNLIGHDWAESLLKKHIANNEARHAYLFTGAPGVGRRSLALAFASARNCVNPPAPGEFCGKCRMCRLTTSMQLPDISLVEADRDGGIIKVSQVRELQRTLALTPYEAKFRIALLLNFQQANANAQNALLKTLEEAPENVVLLLTSDTVDSLLPTIASRCEIIRLRPVAVDVLEEALLNRWNLPAEKARHYAHLASGRTGSALQMESDAEILNARAAWVEELLRLLPLSRRERFGAAENLARNRDQLRKMLQTWLSFSRDLLLTASESAGKVVNLDYLDDIKRIAAKLQNEGSLKMVNLLINTLDDLEVNANLRLLLDNTLLEIPQIN